MAKSQPSESLGLPLKSGAGVKSFTIGIGSRFDVPTIVMIGVSIVTAYLVLPPLYSVIQTSLFTTKMSGELDQFTLKYYSDLLLQAGLIGPLINTIYFALGSAFLATLIGG